MDEFEKTLRVQRQFWKMAGLLGILLVALTLFSFASAFGFAWSPSLRF